MALSIRRDAAQTPIFQDARAAFDFGRDIKFQNDA
jgi:hypothetical protein